MTARAVILFGHGSRDPQWRVPMDGVAERVASRGVPVRCAFLELQEPDLGTAARQLCGEGATHLTIIPMFLGAGRHVREDLPLLMDDLRRAHPGVQIELRPAVGEEPRVLELLAGLALE